MMRHHCPKSNDLEAALRRGMAEAGDSEHLQRCAVCRTARDSFLLLQRLEQLGPFPRVGTTAESIWWRAQVVRRLQEKSRSEARPRLQVGAMLLALLPLLVTLTWAVWRWTPQLVSPGSALLPVAVAGFSLVLGPLLGWLALWLVEGLYEPA